MTSSREQAKKFQSQQLLPKHTKQTQKKRNERKRQQQQRRGAQRKGTRRQQSGGGCRDGKKGFGI